MLIYYFVLHICLPWMCAYIFLYMCIFEIPLYRLNLMYPINDLLHLQALQKSPAAFSTHSLPLTHTIFFSLSLSLSQSACSSDLLLLHATLNLTCSHCLWHTHLYIYPSILQWLANYRSNLPFRGLF